MTNYDRWAMTDYLARQLLYTGTYIATLFSIGDYPIKKETLNYFIDKIGAQVALHEQMQALIDWEKRLASAGEKLSPLDYRCSDVREYNRRREALVTFLKSE